MNFLLIFTGFVLKTKYEQQILQKPYYETTLFCL